MSEGVAAALKRVTRFCYGQPSYPTFSDRNTYPNRAALEADLDLVAQTLAERETLLREEYRTHQEYGQCDTYRCDWCYKVAALLPKEAPRGG